MRQAHPSKWAHDHPAPWKWMSLSDTMPSLIQPVLGLYLALENDRTNYSSTHPDPEKGFGL